MDNEGISALPFLFLVPILFIIGCFVYDFIPIIKEKSKLNDHMEYVLTIYNEGKEDTKQKIVSYSNSNEIKTEYYIDGDKVTFEITKDVEVTTPVVKLIFGTPYTVKKTKTIEKK